MRRTSSRSRAAISPSPPTVKRRHARRPPRRSRATRSTALQKTWWPGTRRSWSISPGDLDEGIKALLVFRGEGDVERQGAGWARVKAFREGVIKGAESCLNYQA